MEGWRECTLEEMADIQNGFAFKSVDFLEYPIEGSLPVIKIKNVANGDVSLNEVQYHNFDPQYDAFRVSKNDVLIALTGNHPDAETQVVGAVSMYKYVDDSLLNQRVGKFIIKKGIEKGFLYYLLKNKSTHERLAATSSGSANQANISTNNIKFLKFTIPEFSIQQAIAAVLSSLDDKIDLLHRQNKTLEALAQTLFRQWFVEEADEGWEEKPLSFVANFFNGLACQKFLPLNNIERLPVLKIRELTSGITSQSDWASSEVPQEYIVNNGDVIFSWSASLMVKIWSGEQCVLNQHLFKVTSDCYPKWFYLMWCKHHLSEFIIISESHATTMGHIKRGDLDSAMVKIPAPARLKEMSNAIEPLLDRQISNASQIFTLTKLRDTLLPKLMSGEVRVEV